MSLSVLERNTAWRSDPPQSQGSDELRTPTSALQASASADDVNENFTVRHVFRYIMGFLIS